MLSCCSFSFFDGLGPLHCSHFRINVKLLFFETGDRAPRTGDQPVGSPLPNTGRHKPSNSDNPSKCFSHFYSQFLLLHRFMLLLVLTAFLIRHSLYSATALKKLL
jgi:hypothetical protein